MVSLLLSQRCKIIQQNNTLDKNRRTIKGDTIIYDSLRCRLDTRVIRSPERPEEGSVHTDDRAMIYVEPKSDITPDMRIELDNQIYEIVSVGPVSNLRGLNHLEIEVVRSVNP